MWGTYAAWVQMVFFSSMWKLSIKAPPYWHKKIKYDNLSASLGNFWQKENEKSRLPSKFFWATRYISPSFIWVVTDYDWNIIKSSQSNIILPYCSFRIILIGQQISVYHHFLLRHGYIFCKGGQIIPCLAKRHSIWTLMGLF